jgi:hypothetical protein
MPCAICFFGIVHTSLCIESRIVTPLSIYVTIIHHTLPICTPSCPTALCFDIPTPLQKHPNQTRIRNNQRPRQRLPPPRCPKYPPLTHKVSPSHRITPHSQLIERGVVYIVGGVEAHHGCEECPGTECAGREGCDVFGGDGGRVDGRGVVDA